MGQFGLRKSVYLFSPPHPATAGCRRASAPSLQYSNLKITLCLQYYKKSHNIFPGVLKQDGEKKKTFSLWLIRLGGKTLRTYFWAFF